MTDDWLEARYEKDPNIVYREIAGEAILVPIRKQTADIEGIFTLNETGAFIWKLFDGRRSLAEIGAAVVEEYDASQVTVEADLAELVSSLKEIGALRTVGG